MRKLSKSLLSSLGLSILVAACGTAGTAAPSEPSSVNPPASDPATTTESLRSGPYSDKSSINVAKSASLSIGLRGGAVAPLGDQTVQRALIDLEAVELVSSTGSTLSLLASPVTLDLFALQNDLAQIVQSQSLEPGVYSQIRCRVGGVFIGTLDGSGNPVGYLSGDASAFDNVPADGNLPLSLGQVDADGSFNVGLPESGLAVGGATSFALRFDLADSLFMQGQSLVFNPVVWAADASQLSSVEVAIQVSSDVDMSSFDGFQLELLDAAQLPVCFVPVAAAGQVLSATFQYLDVVEGPFTAVLVPPLGVALSTQIAVAIDIAASVHAETTVSFQSVSHAEQGSTVVLDIHSENKAKCVQHSFDGTVVNTGTAAVGSFDQVAQPWQQIAPVTAHQPQWSHPEDMPTSQQPFDNRTGHGGVERPGHDTGPEIQKPGAADKDPSPGNHGNATPAHGDEPPIQSSPLSPDKNPGPQKNPDSSSIHPSNPPPVEDTPVSQPPKQSSAPPTNKNPGQGKGGPSLNSNQQPPQDTPPKQSSAPAPDKNPGHGKGSLSLNSNQQPPQDTPPKQSSAPAPDKNPGQGKGSPSLNSNQQPPQDTPPKQSSAPAPDKNPGQGKGSPSPSNSTPAPAHETPPSQPPKQSSTPPATHTDEGITPVQSPPPKDVKSGSGGGPSGGNQGSSKGDAGDGGSKPGNKHP